MGVRARLRWLGGLLWLLCSKLKRQLMAGCEVKVRVLSIQRDSSEKSPDATPYTITFGVKGGAIQSETTIPIRLVWPASSEQNALRRARHELGRLACCLAAATQDWIILDDG